MTFGEKLTSARKQKNLSQEELAKKLYVTRQAISRWENNTAQPSLEMLSAICRELEKTPNDFIETERENSLRFYKSLSFQEKFSLALEWRGEHKLICFLMAVFNIINCVGVGLITYFVIPQNNISQNLKNSSPSLFAACLSGAALLAVLSIALSVFTVINNAVKYNAWLLQKKSIIRKRK